MRTLSSYFGSIINQVLLKFWLFLARSSFGIRTMLRFVLNRCSPRIRILATVLAFLVAGAPCGGPRAEEAAFAFENAEISTVLKRVSELTGLTILFDPEEIQGRITLFSSRRVSSHEALELLESALALHGYRLLEK